jgi:NADH-quinone oxidoreductase subunit H
MLIMSSIGTLCFLGGWTLPKFVMDALPFLAGLPNFVWVAVFLAKVYFFMFLFYWVRATLPRYRYDQLMNIGWKVLIPLALVNIVITGTLKIMGWV